MTDSLSTHPAVVDLGSGVSSSVLADFTRAIAEQAAQRIETVGHAQYSSEQLEIGGDGWHVSEAPQKFETASLSAYVDELLDEVADINAYLAIIAIKVLAMKAKVQA